MFKNHTKLKLFFIVLATVTISLKSFYDYREYESRRFIALSFLDSAKESQEALIKALDNISETVTKIEELPGLSSPDAYSSELRERMDLLDQRFQELKKELTEVNADINLYSTQLDRYSTKKYLWDNTWQYGLAFLIAYFSTIYIKTQISSSKEKEEQAKKYEEEASELQDNNNTEEFYSNSVKSNFKYQHSFYLQSKLQSEKSFGFSVGASIASFAIIFIGVYSMLFNENSKDIDSTIMISVGAFSQFISAVFFYLYSKTTKQLSSHLQKLVLTQNINLALRLTEDISSDEQRDSVRRELALGLIGNINEHLSTTQASKSNETGAK